MSDEADRTRGDDPSGEGILRQKFRRFSITDDGLAWLLLGSLIFYVGLSGSETWGFAFANINPAVVGVYITIVGVATTWVFGKQAVKTWRSGTGDG
ncbi:hypothetical protein [Haloplanus halophilus]|uniref:hypothetical protein n=1 Tax=Haloplanus halophilus TaxID=2949993 RepID=UPI00203DC11C|nr:hypothetical protein [Haloplanus sp. GDY1]